MAKKPVTKKAAPRKRAPPKKRKVSATKKHKNAVQRYVDWVKIRAIWEAEAQPSFKALEEQFGVSRQTISKHCKEEGWTRFNPNESGVQKAIRERADEKNAENPVEALVLEDPAPAGQTSPLAKSAAIEARAAVIDRHRREINLPRNRLYQALQENSFDKMKQAKITAETIAIIQATERKAWGLDGDQTFNVRVIESRRDHSD